MKTPNILLQIKVQHFWHIVKNYSLICAIIAVKYFSAATCFYLPLTHKIQIHKQYQIVIYSALLGNDVLIGQ